MVDCVHLQELQISQRNLRFLEWDSINRTNSNSQVLQDSIPLFLGADVLSGCSIAVSNLPRMHAKFAKQGLAVKVNFPISVRLQGVHGSARGVWFYSIQGLFRVCFEYYNREEQLECLTHLCPLWKQRISDPPFQQEIELRTEKASRCLGSFELEGDKRLTRAITCTPNESDNLYLTESRSTQTEETYTLTCNDNSIASSIATSSIEKEDSACVTPIGKECIEEIVRLCKNEDQAESDSLAVITIRILNEFEVQRSQEHSSSSRILVAISKCLGDEFNKLQLEIGERVTEFKKKHITSIDNLPPSSELVKELFPECMRVLLLHWMRNEDQPNINSIMQVILELANTSLVSGVAHVLYSRLIRTDTV